MIARALVRGVLVAMLVVIGFGAATAPAANAATCGAPHDCGPGASVTARGASPSSGACIHDAGCGGGAALGGWSTSVLIAVVAAAVGLVLRRLLWIVAARRSTFATRLLAGGLFRPPRLSS